MKQLGYHWASLPIHPKRGAGVSNESGRNSAEEWTLAHFDESSSRQDINNRIPRSVFGKRIGRWPDFFFLFLYKAKLFFQGCRDPGCDLCLAEVVIINT